MKSISHLMILCLLILLFGGLTSQPVQAAESGGGQVSNPSTITFFEGDKVVPDAPKELPSTIESPPKKLSLLPQTGERIEWSFLAGGTCLSLIGIGVIIHRMRRPRHEK